MEPIVILIDGSFVDNWTEMSLSRAKKDMTGSLSFSLFYSAVPLGVVLKQACPGAKVQCLIAGNVAFTGVVDSRSASGDAKSYAIKISCRGKTKSLIDSSHQHKTGTILNTTNKDAMQELVSYFGIEIDWKATQIDLPRVTFRDGGYVSDELHRIGAEHSHFMWESTEGNLIVTDDNLQKSGDPIIYADGGNVLSFSVEQSEHGNKKKVKVKGKRTDKKIRGRKSIEKTYAEVTNGSMVSDIPFTLHHFGDGTDDALQRRAKFEVNKRSSESLSVKVDVLHVQSPSGNPWDVGMLHMVVIGSEGLSNVLECTNLEYSCSYDNKIKTTLTLSPPAKTAMTGAGVTTLESAAKSGPSSEQKGTYPLPWAGPDISLDTQDTTIA